MTNYQKRFQENAVEWFKDSTIGKVSKLDVESVRQIADWSRKQTLEEVKLLVDEILQLEKAYLGNGGLFNPELTEISGERLQSLIKRLSDLANTMKGGKGE